MKTYKNKVMAIMLGVISIISYLMGFDATFMIVFGTLSVYLFCSKTEWII